MKIYNYDKDTKEYLFDSEAYEDPVATKREGKFVPQVPANSTTIKPLNKKDKYTIILNDNNGWEYAEDHRGEEVINPSTDDIIIVNYIGKLQDGYVNYEEYKKTEEYKEKQKQKEKERISKLRCTKRVFALCLKEFGISYSQLKEVIASNEDAQLEWDLCVELERCNPMIDTMASKLGITSKQLDLLFRYANGELESLEV